MRKIIFLADLFKGQALGGAELHDAVVAEYFEKKGSLKDRINCSYLTDEYLKENKDNIWFIGNFSHLSSEHKAYLSGNCNYIIYEHDYKFCKNRNPINYLNFVCPKYEKTNINFYSKAKKVICLSRFHREIFDKNIDIVNLENIHCSMWSDSDLEFISDIEKKYRNSKKNKFAIIDSKNPIKKTFETKEFCDTNNIDYDMIASPDYRNFLETMASYKGLVFQTGHPEPTPRVAIEAKMLGCSFKSQKGLIGVAHEDYFNLTGQAMIKKVREMRDVALENIWEWIYE
tara:strand:- start:441 stop:1298 length:858 start_codon:yes stop_codon:yes gene_type:complete